MGRVGIRARQRRRKEFILGGVVIACVVAIVIAVAAYIFSQPKELDQATMCPAEGPAGHYVILVDKTDPLTFIQKQALVAILREVIEKRIPQKYMLSIFVLGEDFKQNAAPLLELCNPGSGGDKSEWTANIAKLRRQYETKFIEPLMKQTDALMATQAAKNSPIFEMLQLISVNAFRRQDVKGDRRLILISDMLQNTPQMSMFRQTVDYQTFAASDYGKRMHLELSGVEVELHYLMNWPQLQTKRNLKFWNDHFNNAGARIVAVRPLEG